MGPPTVSHSARTAVTGRSVGPSLFEVLGCLGRERVARRLRDVAALV